MSSLAILGPPFAFDLACYYFVACSLKNLDNRFELDKGNIKLSDHNWHWHKQYDLWRLLAKIWALPTVSRQFSALSLSTC